MKIRKIQFVNHPIFNDLSLDFTDRDGKTINTIILAGENGSGKSLLLNIIFEFTKLEIWPIKKNEKRFFEIELSKNEIEYLRSLDSIKLHFNQPFKDNIFNISIDYNIGDNWNQISINALHENGTRFNLMSSTFSHPGAKNALRAIFSDAEINFTPEAINTVTSLNIDTEVHNSEKSHNQMATQIAQLLIDVQSIDSQEFTDWAKANSGKLIDDSKIDVRIKRFSKSFEFMFPIKKYKRIETISNQKQVIFEEHGKEMSLTQLSSGEKQIVFRGGFLLKNQKVSNGNLILIDEPEISLHPNWQLTIVSFFKKLFTNNDGEQTSQIIIATHSPFILHNANRIDDKVIVLKKESSGQIIVLDKPEFYAWSSARLVQEAFNISNLFHDDKITVFLEGETDERYYNQCLHVFDKLDCKIVFNWIGRINEKGQAINTGDSALNRAKTFFTANMVQIKNKMILFYDSDTNNKNENIENLLIRCMSVNTQNTLFKKGVENLLTVNGEFDLDPFYNEKKVTDDYGATSTHRSLHKTKLCNYICDTLTKEQQAKVLLKVNIEIDRLLTELGCA